MSDPVARAVMTRYGFELSGDVAVTPMSPTTPATATGSN